MPTAVCASTPLQTAERYGLARRGPRCRGCPEAERCPFYLDLAAYPEMKMLYLDNEQHDGYHRDQCVFSADTDIEDTLHAVISYRGGVQMSYSLHAYMPWEGLTIAFNGSKGRLEHTQQETVYLNGDGTVPGELLAEPPTPASSRISRTRHRRELDGRGRARRRGPAVAGTAFRPRCTRYPYMRGADERGGAWSVLVGAAVNRRCRWGKVRIADLVSGLDLPDYPPMPSPTDL